MWLTLTGFMASGKTTVARQLGAAMSRVVVSLDELAARRADCSLVEYFAEHGEARFRDLELELLGELDPDADLILDIGGGLVETAAAVTLIRSRGAVIWLDAPWSTVLGRLQDDGERTRPLVGTLGWDGLESLYHRRLPLYAQAADFRLQGDGGSEALANQAGLCWRRWLDLNRVANRGERS